MRYQEVSFSLSVFVRAQTGFLNSLLVVLRFYCEMLFVIVCELLYGERRTLDSLLALFFNFGKQILDVLAGFALSSSEGFALAVVNILGASSVHVTRPYRSPV